MWDKTQVLLGTSWGMHLETFLELDGNTLGTKENPKNSLSPPSPHPKRKTLDHSRVHAEPWPNIGCMKFLFPKLLFLFT
jgi:hypothetical protein